MSKTRGKLDYAAFQGVPSRALVAAGRRPSGSALAAFGTGFAIGFAASLILGAFL
jgi:hypothetical protein